MARRGPLHDVELVEDDDAGADAPADPGGTRPATSGAPDAAGERDTRRRRRAMALGAAVLAVLVAAGVVGQAVVDGRQRARVAAVAAQPMGVGLLTGPPSVRWRTTSEARNVLGDLRTPQGDLVGVVHGGEGPVAVVARDDATGEELWRSELIDGSTRRALPAGAESFSWSGSCAEHPDDAHLTVCLVHDGADLLVDGEWEALAPSTVRVVTLDVRDGAVVDELTDDLGISTLPNSFEVVGRLVVATAVTDDAMEVRAVTAEGEPAWDTTVPAGGGGEGRMRAFVTALGDLAAIITPTELRLVDAAGRTERSYPLDEQWVGANGDRSALYVEPFPTEDERDRDGTPVPDERDTLVVRADGDVAVTGRATYVTLDDGSVPGLVLTDADGRLTAWDGDGARLWSSDVTTDLSSVVLDGRVHVRGAGEVVTLDARTGDELWRSDAATTLPVTDGRHLLAVAAAPSRGVSRELVALDPADGSELWRSPLPDTTEEVVGHLGLLVAIMAAPDAGSAAGADLVVLG